MYSAVEWARVLVHARRRQAVRKHAAVRKFQHMRGVQLDIRARAGGRPAPLCVGAASGRKTCPKVLVHFNAGNPMKKYRAMQLRFLPGNVFTFAALFACVTLAAGCTDKIDPNICGGDQVYGCALLQTLVSADSVSLPPSHMVSIRVSPARADATWSGDVSQQPTVGNSLINLYLRTPLTPTSVDTVSVWIVAGLLELPIPPSPGVPFKTIASDSTKHVLRVSKSGGLIVPQTVQLRLRKLAAN